MEINILTANGKKTIDAYPLLINFKRQNNLFFFIHENITNLDTSLDTSENDEKYNKIVITEYSSGCICAYGKTKQDAIQMLKDRVEKYSEETFIQLAIETVIKEGFNYPVNE